MLNIDRQARLIWGRVIPWNTPGVVNRKRIALYEDSLTWPESVKLLICHNNSLIAGQAVALASVRDGLHVSFLVRSGAKGDRALSLAEVGWGLSAGFDLVEFEDRDNAIWCIRGEISEISLVPNPAFP